MEREVAHENINIFYDTVFIVIAVFACMILSTSKHGTFEDGFPTFLGLRGYEGLAVKTGSSGVPKASNSGPGHFLQFPPILRTFGKISIFGPQNGR